MSKTYDWRRYWYKNGNSPHIIDGFLYIHEYTKETFTLDTVSDIPCLVLLGEPGMGKSREIELIYENLIEDENHRKLYFPLSRYSSEERLVKDIFELETTKQWKKDNTNLYLFLDGLDEALLKNIALVIADEVGKLPKERLFLRIACRTAEWSNLSFLENKLKEIWKEDKCQILQIAPLQRKDVELAAKYENLDAEKFISEIYNKSVTTLASKPVTLQFLLNLFGKNGSFPSTQTELYEKGCLALCEEKNQRRIASKLTGNLTTEQKFVIAARIAALMIFGNKSSIWLSGITGEEENSDILISELSGYTEKGKDNIEFQITEENIREVISSTGLFIGNGNTRLKFFHQTFAEFFAAWYLEYQKLSDESIIKIIGEEYLYPQLYETSAWIASRRKSIFQRLIQIDPLVLLRSDVLAAEESLREKLTARLLELFENEDARDWDTRVYYQKLKNPNLAEQLRLFITDKTKGWLVKRVAIDIAEACEVQELQNDLLNLVLDETELHSTRVNGAYAVMRIGDKATKLKLQPLIYENDEKLELKGVAITALWREQLTTEELFEIFVEPPHSFLGSYKSFFYKLSGELQIEDLPIALKWLQKRIAETGDLSIEMQGFGDDLMRTAWQNLDNEKVFEEYIKTILPFLKIQRQGYINSENNYTFDQQTNDKRRKVLMRLLPLLNEQNDWWELNGSALLGFQFDDVPWLIEEWNTSVDEKIKQKILSLLRDFVLSGQGFFSQGLNSNFLSLIFGAIEIYPELKKELGRFFEAIELNSEKATELKESYENLVNRHKRRDQENEESLHPTPKERVLDCLEKFENGDINWFWQLNLEMTIKPKMKFYGDELQSDLTKLSGWQEADEEIKNRIIEAAKKYIIAGDPTANDEWIEKNTIYRPAYAGYRAIRLISQFDSDFIKNLNEDIWRKWSPIIYFYPVFNGSESDSYNFHRQIVASTYKIAPEKFVEFLSREIEKENRREENPHLSFGKLDFCWDENLKKVLKDSLVGFTLKESLISQILEQLFELNDEDAEKIACDLVKFPAIGNEKTKKLMSIGATLLIQFEKMRCWEKIWKGFKHNPEFGKKIIESGVFRFRRQGIGNLTEEQIADLYIWLSTQYPHNEDPNFSGESMAHFVGSREETASWRNSLLDYLKSKGTRESVTAIEKIKKALPHLDWLKFSILDARENMRLNTWQPISPKELFGIIQLDKKQQELINLEKEFTEESETIKKYNETANKQGKRKASLMLILIASLISVSIGLSFYYGFTYIGVILSVIFLLVPAIVSSIKGKEWTFSKAAEQFIDADKKKLYLLNQISEEEHGKKQKKINEIKAEIKMLKSIG